MVATLNLKEFRAEVRKEKAIARKRLLTLHKGIATDAAVGLVDKTPVDTGLAQGNWQGQVDGPKLQQVATLDKEGGKTINSILSALKALKPFGVFWITNNVDYIEFLENGSSDQAPNGMLSLTVVELNAKFK